MAEFLRQGAKMLDLTCPACGNPLFKLKNSEIYCPSCEKKVIIEKQGQPTEKKQKLAQAGKDKNVSDLGLVLNQKLNDLKNRLATETDLSTIYKILKTIKLGITILNEIKQNQ